jgi:hypothetical protein
VEALLCGPGPSARGDPGICTGTGASLNLTCLSLVSTPPEGALMCTGSAPRRRRLAGDDSRYRLVRAKQGSGGREPPQQVRSTGGYTDRPPCSYGTRVTSVTSVIAPLVRSRPPPCVRAMLRARSRACSPRLSHGGWVAVAVGEPSSSRRWCVIRLRATVRHDPPGRSERTQREVL